MTANRGVGVPVTGTAPNQVGTTATDHRLQMAGQYAENAPGVPRSGVLFQADPLLVKGRADMSYDIGPCQLVISRTASEGVYTPTLTGTTNIGTNAAPASGSRWDLVYVLQRDPAKTDADNLATVGVVQGVAGSSPQKPTASLPAGAYVLAEAQIFSGTTGTSAAPNTIAQVWRHTVARGAPIPIRNTTEQSEVAPGKGTRIQRLDLPSLPIYSGDGAAWVFGEESADAPTTAGWTSTGRLSRRLLSNGSYRYSLEYTAVRTGANVSLGAAGAGLWNPLQAGWRPSSNVNAYGAVRDNFVNFTGGLNVQINTDGAIFISTLSGGALTVLTNGSIYFNATWVA